ncbi:MAG: lyase family protein [Gemmatimonadota bacterium]
MKKSAARRPARRRTLWSSAGLDRAVFDFTATSDHTYDAQLLRWDILGSLGHVEGLAASGLLRPVEHRQLRRALRLALKSEENGELSLLPDDEDVHTAVENWLTGRFGGVGEMLHTGRSRNDQVAADLRLLLKDRLLTIHSAALLLVAELLAFARREQRSLWPGYTHTRRAMPSSAGLWSAGLAAGLLDTLAALPGTWMQVDRSPLGSGAGYGVPLPLDREATARALGFSDVDPLVTTTQNARGKLEAAVVFWCVQLGHDLSRLASDAILLSAEEYGYLDIPRDLATGSSIMPHKQNPDLFELTRGNAAAIEGDLSAILAVRSKLTGGYHRDFQLLKEPLLRALARTESILRMMGLAVPRLTVNRARSREALKGGAMSTDEVMRRVEGGARFRAAYRDVALAIKRGEKFDEAAESDLIERRQSTGGLGNLGLQRLAGTARTLGRWERGERKRFSRALEQLRGRPL